MDASPRTGYLIMNADDWGRDEVTTDRILTCCKVGSVSAVSAMVFMQDSARAADLALQQGIDTGLHLNLTTEFSAAGCSAKLLDNQQRVARYLLRHRLAQIMFNPALASAFDYVVKAQFEEFQRLYREQPAKVDGHHHMHLCSNVLLQRLLPQAMMARRNFSFDRGEKGIVNRIYRKLVDRSLIRRHKVTDAFFSLAPLEPAARLQRIYELANRAVVEVAAHPFKLDEYQYLTGGEIFRQLGQVRMMSASAGVGLGRLAEATSL
jgi:predicted glycoside hydrolase/deacetylase ChbG (UPF0249 family)